MKINKTYNKIRFNKIILNSKQILYKIINNNKTNNNKQITLNNKLILNNKIIINKQIIPYSKIKYNKQKLYKIKHNRMIPYSKIKHNKMIQEQIK